MKRFLALLFVLLGAVLMAVPAAQAQNPYLPPPAGIPPGSFEVSYHPIMIFSLGSAQYFAGSRYDRPHPVQCPPRNGAPFGIRVFIVPSIGGYSHGGYAPPGRCEVWIGFGSWSEVVAYEKRRWGRWVRTSFCPLVGHEFSHQVLNDGGSHAHTPDLNNPLLKFACRGAKVWRRGRLVFTREIGWNRWQHPPRRHG